MRLAKALAHALILAAVANILAGLLRHVGPGFSFLVDQLGWGWFVPFAIATACALHNQKALSLVLLGVVLLIAVPLTLAILPVVLVPVGAGILAGTGLRRLFAEGGTPSQ